MEYKAFARAADALLGPLLTETANKLGADLRLEEPRIKAPTFAGRAKIKHPWVELDISIAAPAIFRRKRRKIIGCFYLSNGYVTLKRASQMTPLYRVLSNDSTIVQNTHIRALLDGRLGVLKR
jgi:hypothetical protein